MYLSTRTWTANCCCGIVAFSRSQTRAPSERARSRGVNMDSSPTSLPFNKKVHLKTTNNCAKNHEKKQGKIIEFNLMKEWSFKLNAWWKKRKINKRPKSNNKHNKKSRQGEKINNKKSLKFNLMKKDHSNQISNDIRYQIKSVIEKIRLKLNKKP